jgi:hypothetical protein
MQQGDIEDVIDSASDFGLPDPSDESGAIWVVVTPPGTTTDKLGVSWHIQNVTGGGETTSSSAMATTSSSAAAATTC